jgi:streptomycin 6-kinase
MKPLPRVFIQRIQRVFGDQGRSWLDQLPSLRAELIERWSLEDNHPIPDLSYNYLEYARSSSGDQVVLKIGVPNPELETEIRTLEFYEGQGMVRLVDADPSLGALLLERVLPGTVLSYLADDDHATRIAGKVLADLWKPAPHADDFPTAADWCRGYDRYLQSCSITGDPLSCRIVKQAKALSSGLLKDSADKYLLHGDFHHANLLYREDSRWILIDPKGVIGERAFEIGSFLYNPISKLGSHPDLARLLERRLAILGELTGLERDRLAAWSFCRAVLSAIWSLEDEGINYQHGMIIAKCLLPLL